MSSRKPMSEHAVGLVEDDEADLRGVEEPPLQVVHDAPRGSDNHLCAALEIADLGVVGGTSVEGGHAGATLPAELRQRPLDLHRELAGGADHEGLGPVEVGVEPLEEGKAEGGGLPGTGLGDPDDVLALERHRDGLGLDGGRLLEVHLLDDREQSGVEPELGELRGGFGRLAHRIETGMRLAKGPGPGGAQPRGTHRQCKGKRGRSERKDGARYWI